MDRLKRCKTSVIFTLLSILTAASTKNKGGADIKKCMKRLQTNIQACKEPLHYAVYRPENNANTIKDLLKLRQGLKGTVTPDKTMTIITLSQCDRNFVESKDNYMREFTSVMQQYLANESDRTFSAGNLKVTIDLVEEEFLPGYKMMRSIQEEAFMTCNNLNILIIDNLDKIFFGAFKQWVIDQAKGHFAKYSRKVITIHGEDIASADTFLHEYTSFLDKVESTFWKRPQKEKMSPVLKNYQIELDKIRDEVIKFEELQGISYFTANHKEFQRVFNHLTWSVYYDHSNKSMLKVAKACFKAMRDMKNSIKIGKAFDAVSETFLRCTAAQDRDVKADDDVKTSSSVAKPLCHEKSHVFFDSCGFDSLQQEFSAIKCPIRDRLRKNFEIHATTEICINDKISIDNFCDFLRVFDEENVCNDLKRSKALFIEIEKKLGEQTNPSEDDSWDMIDEDMIDKDMNDDVNPLLNNANGMAFLSKVISADQKWNFIDQSEQQESLGVSITRNITNLEMIVDIDTIITKHQMIRGNEMRELYNISVKSDNFNVNISLMNDIAADGVPIKKSIIYDITEIDSNRYTSKRSVVYLDDVPLLVIHNLIVCLQLIQLLRPNKFEIPNVMSLDEKDVTYIETYTEIDSIYFNIFSSQNMSKNQLAKKVEGGFIKRFFFSDKCTLRRVIEKLTNSSDYDITQFGFSEANFDRLTRKPFCDNCFTKDDLDDPFIIENPAASYYMNSQTYLDKHEKMLNVTVSKSVCKIDYLLVNPLQIVNKLLRNKHRREVLAALTSIAKEVEADFDAFLVVIGEMCKADEQRCAASISGFSKENQWRKAYLQMICRMFRCTEAWKDEFAKVIEEDKWVFEICPEQEQLLSSSIEVLLRSLMDNFSADYPTFLKTVSIIKISREVMDETNVLIYSKHNLSDISYCNLKDFKKVCKHSIVNVESKEDE